MEWIARGVQHFRDQVYPGQRDLFELLAQGQSPQVLFVTCSDSRVDPNLITHSKPGELFHLRNAGNIVPSYGNAGGAEAATIEYAVSALGIRNIVVCGHTDCGAMKGLLHPEKISDLSSVTAWLQHSESARRVALAAYGNREESAKIRALVEQNVLAQLLHLQTHPSVAACLATGEMSLFGWVYEIASGRVFAYRPDSNRFEPLTREITSVPGFFSKAELVEHARAVGD